MESIINIIVILAGVVLFIIFIRQNFTGENRGQATESCDCSSCTSETCITKNNLNTKPDK